MFAKLGLTGFGTGSPRLRSSGESLESKCGCLATMPRCGTGSPSYGSMLVQAIGFICAHAGKMVILLTCGGDKKSQKRDIERAIRILGDWEKRNA